MSLTIRPVISALLRNRTGALLVAFQIAIALAVLVNAIYIVHQRIEKMSRPTRIDDRNLFGVSVAGLTDQFNYDAAREEDLAYLRGLPGVISASASNSVPLAISGSSNNMYTQPDGKGRSVQTNYFFMDEQGLNTLGVRLLAGRGFRADEILPGLTHGDYGTAVPEQIVTQSVAETLFPHQNALGRTIYDHYGHPSTIIGIIDNMTGTGYWAYEAVDHVAIYPRQPGEPPYGFGYLVRTEPGRRDAIMRIATEHLSAANPDRVIKWVRSVEFFKKRLDLDDRNMAIFLITVTVLLVAITCLGIFGLATFNVSTRTKQIGTRRAVGARKRDIVQYFMVENGLITSAGIVTGCVLALGMGYWLSQQYHLPRLDLYYLVGSVLALWVLGQLAAWHPARRAATVPPSVATRTA
jgi:putative ABC transport system permease protein